MGTMLLFSAPVAAAAGIRRRTRRCGAGYTTTVGVPASSRVRAYAGGPVRTCGSAGKQVAVGEGMSMRQLVRCWRGVGGLGDGGRDARLG